MLASVTGWEVGLEDLLTIGERIWNLKRVLNSRLGLDRGNDRLPKTLLKPLSDGGAAGNQLDLDLMLREYYAVRGWDWDTGQPTHRKLVSLGLDEIAALTTRHEERNRVFCRLNQAIRCVLSILERQNRLSKRKTRFLASHVG